MHVHTPSSALPHSLGDDWDIYVEKLIDAAHTHQISAIATADYFTIDGYKRLLGYYNKETQTLAINRKTVHVLIIPGVELRLNIFNDQEDSINLHVFFDPEYSVDFITQNFLEELSVAYRGTSYPMKQQNLLAIGKSIAENSPANFREDFNGVSDGNRTGYIRNALSTVTLSYRNIEDSLKAVDEIFERKHLPQKSYLIAVVGKGHGGISALKWFEENKSFSRAGLIREHLTHQADLIFSNDPRDRAFYLGKDAGTPVAEVEARFENLKPCIWGSDSHYLDKLLHPSNGNSFDYTWIKADLSFEGFKQITFEPQLRIRVQRDDPTEEETYAKIESLNVDFPEDLKIRDKGSNESIPFCILGKQEISFSSNLTCIIGGRGSGKSTITHLLYNQIPKVDTNRLSQINSPLLSLELGSKDVLGRIRSTVKTSLPNSTEFFLQNEVEKFARDVNEMSALIKTRLFGLSMVEEDEKGLRELESEWRAKDSEFEKLIAAYDDIASIQEQIVLVENEKETLRKQTEIISSEDYKNLQSDIERISNEISSFDTYEKEYRQIVAELSKISKSVERLDWQKYGGQGTLSSVADGIKKMAAEFDSSFNTAKTAYDSAEYVTKLNEKKIQLKEFLKEKGLSPENVGEIASATQQIAELEEQTKTLKKQLIPHTEVYGTKDDLVSSLKETHENYVNKFLDVTGKLRTALRKLRFDEEDTIINFELRTNDQPLKDVAADFIKDSNTSKVTLRSDHIQNVLFGSDAFNLADIIADPTKLVEAVNESENADVHTQIIQGLLSEPVVLEKLHLRITRQCFDINNIQVHTKLGDRQLQNTSFGERCGIVIAIVLVAGTNPIVIDQPEDNLDGKYISNVLVPLIRDQKQKRQIILITRDANIAIGGDSELILILAKHHSIRGTQLLPATIENKELRSEYIWILDGGDRAFKKREEKYSIRREP